VDTDGTTPAGAVTRGRTLGSDVDGGWRNEGIADVASPLRGVRAGAVYRPESSGLLPAAGSPSVRNSPIFSLALAVAETAHRSTIIPPSSVAMARDGSDLAVLFKVKTPASRDPSPPHRIDEVQQLTRRIKLMRCTGTSRDYPV